MRCPSKGMRARCMHAFFLIHPPAEVRQGEARRHFVQIRADYKDRNSRLTKIKQLASVRIGALLTFPSVPVCLRVLHSMQACTCDALRTPFINASSSS